MSDHARRLLGRILLDRDVSEALRRGVTADMFRDPKLRDVFRFVVKHQAEYDEVPTPTSVVLEFPGLKLPQVEDGLEYLIDDFLSRNRHDVVVRTLDSAVRAIESRSDTDDIVTILREGLAAIDTVHSRAISDYDLTASPLERFKEYEALEGAVDGLLGIPTGFPTIDRATAGLQPGQLVTIIAAPKTGKSQLALKIASNMHMDGSSPVFQSFEMSNAEQKQRFDSLRFELSHSRLRRGQLVQDEKDRYREELEALEGMHPMVLLDSATGITVSALSAKVQQYKPDAVFIDGVYLMVDEQTGEQNTPQALTNITRSLKRMAQRLQVPVVISTQTLTWKMKRNQVTANSIGYSSSFFQDSDVILGLERIEGEEESPLRRLKIVASRNCPNAEVDLLWDWDSGRFEEPDQSPSDGYEDEDDAYVYRRDAS